MRVTVLITLLVVSACASAPEVVSSDPVVAHGHELVATYCGSCHAISRTDSSRRRGAPAFRTLSERYPVSDLGEGLAEGLVVGHSDMPEIEFPAPDVEAVIAYLESIQKH